ncbi:sigma 54-interacting transcriptional regulator [Lacticaseibacillus daqingensis]|uniref:sigma 54-interacting transcriptional regulator n=1 Tax=Lacticaseibacillus daqingensis TaxID=2486014 RepID=UPI000F78D4FE|nr:sigma 54-interacting transcriptional regulator [Lacticaseibacillus daqingensis]
MRATEKVLQVFEHTKAGHEFTTQEIAKAVGLTRGVVSSYLSQLYQAGKLAKTGSRPVYWSLKQTPTSFSQIIGFDGSLSQVIANSRESMVYPGGGFPLLITGNSGVGKSFLAKTIYAEARRLHLIADHAEFVTLNAADYANNPDLLSSVLFGYKRGAFTGAMADTKGLIDRADGGYLFLDEVHRLPHSSQEKLFSLLDANRFYPLGETEHPRSAHVRFIFATTESVEAVLLRTLLRRIPLTVHLPDYLERPVTERIAITINAFQNEAIKVNQPFAVPLATISQIANLNLPGNIGSIQNSVTLKCAKAYADTTDRSQPILIDATTDNPVIITPTQQNTQQITNYFSHLTGYNQLLNTAIQDINSSLRSQAPLSEQQFIVRKLLRTVSSGLDTAVFSGTMHQLKERYQHTLHDQYGLKMPTSANYWHQLTSMWMLINYVNFDDTQERVTNLRKSLKRSYPRSFYLVKKFLASANAPLHLQSWPLLFFPLLADSSAVIEAVDFNAILLAHGPSTASSIQNVVNNLCQGYYFEAFDMPVDASINDIKKQVKQYLAWQGTSRNGTIVLLDMGSLNQMFSEIRQFSDQELLVVNNLTTATALDVGLRIQRHDSFDEITLATQKYGDSTGSQSFEGISNRKNIIVSCMSGVGLSAEIKKMMCATLSDNLEIITEDYADLNIILHNNDNHFFKNTQFVITTTDVRTELDIEILNIYNIMDQSGNQQLTQLLRKSGESPANISNLMDHLLKFFSINGIRNRLEFMNPDIVINDVQKIVERFQAYYNITLDAKLKLNLYMHLSLTIERSILSSTSDVNPQAHSFKNPTEEDFYAVSHSIFKQIEIKYNICINNYEISLVFALLEPYLPQK